MTNANNATLLREHYAGADRLMLKLCLFLFAVSLLLASLYGTWGEALLIGGGSVLCLALIVGLAPGELLTRAAMGAGTMVMACLHIHQAHGMIEVHFGIFALLAVLLYYRDWVPILSAAATVAVHHFALYAVQRSEGGVWVLPDNDSGWWVIGVHALYVVIESGILMLLAHRARLEAAQGLSLMFSIRQATRDGIIDLSHETSGRGEVLEKFNGFLRDLRTLVTDSRKVSDTLFEEGRHLSQATRSISRQMDEQRSAIDSISSAAEELTNTASSLASDTRYNGNTVQRVADDSARALKASGENGEALEDLHRRFEDAADKIRSLNKGVSSVGQVLDVIRNVAEQTNLLALNAAIEAARAGDHGRGFAVVADEVRALARQTHDSTGQIHEIIEQLQVQSHASVEAIETSFSQLEHCVAQNRTVAEIIRSNEAAAGELFDLSRNMMTFTEEQGRAAEEVSRAIVELLGGAERANQDSDNAASTGRALEEQAAQLNGLLTKFA